jgi:type I restriction enzyme S subunit
MNNNFIQTTLGELVSKEKKSIISGPFGSNIGKIFFKETGIPVIRGNNLSTGWEKFKDGGFVFITREKADELNCYAIKNDLIFTAVGTIGQVGIIEEKLEYDEYVISNKQLRVRFDNNKITPLFAYYWFSSYWIQKLIVQRNVGSTVPLINLSVLKGLPITLPKSIDIQNGIVGILENITGKIELNNRINAELEAMAKTIYDFWFVQFDFPVKHGKPYKTSGGKMVWNDELKREIPEGWEVKDLEKIIKIRNGFAFKSEDYQEVGVPIMRTKNFNDGSIVLEDIVYLSTDKAKEYKGYFLGKFDFLVVMVGASVGKMVITPSYILPALQNQNMWNFLPKRNNQKLYTNFLISKVVEEQLKTASGSAREFFRKDHFYGVKVTIPNDEVIESFERLVTPLFEKIDLNISENQKLTELRDWLLPMLMNGQVKIN